MDETKSAKYSSSLSLLYVQTVILITVLIVIMFVKTIFPETYAVVGGYITVRMSDTTSASLVTDNSPDNTESDSDINNTQISAEPMYTDPEVGEEDSESGDYEFDFGVIRKVASTRKAIVGMKLPIIPKKVTSQFGYRVNPVTGNYGIHGGIDLAADAGTQIHPALPGTVTKAKYSSDYGYFVMIDHGDNVVTLYAHCSELIAQPGDTVDENDVIALVGSTGQSTGPHLHFELRINNVRINPVYYLTGLSEA